jgi:hypothetical protein
MSNKIKSIYYVFIIISLLSFRPSSTTIYGDFKSIKMVGYGNNEIMYTFYNSLVKLYPEATDANMMFKASRIGSVNMNSKPLKYQNNIKAYLDSTERMDDGRAIWSVSSNSVFSAFTFSCPLDYPTFTTVENIPDTIKRSSNYIINIGNVQNADFVEFIFDDFTFHNPVPWYRKINVSANTTIVIPGVNFSTITTQTGFVRLAFTKGLDTILNEKKFRFEKRLIVVKPVVIIN